MTKNEKIGVLLEVQEKLLTLLVANDNERKKEEFYKHYEKVVALDNRMKGIRDSLKEIYKLIQDEKGEPKVFDIDGHTLVQNEDLYELGAELYENMVYWQVAEDSISGDMKVKDIVHGDIVKDMRDQWENFTYMVPEIAKTIEEDNK